MGFCCMPRCAALLLGVLVAAGGTTFPKIATAQQNPDGFSTCQDSEEQISLVASLDAPVKFSCATGSALKPQTALSGKKDVALNSQCSEEVSFSTLGFTAQLTDASKGRLGGTTQATQYQLSFTKLPSAEENICYVCEASKAEPDVSSTVGLPNGGSDASPKKNCNVKIRIPADKSATSTAAPSSSTPAPSSSSTSTSSAAAPSSSITTFIGTFSVWVCLVKTYLA